MNAPDPAHMNVHEIRQAIEVLKNEQMALPNPSLALIEGQIQHHAARTIVGSPEEVARHKTELQSAIHAKGEAERHLARRTQIDHELARLNQDLQMAQEFERVSKAQTASAQCTQAYNEYVAASKATARAFRRVMRANANAYNVPGAVRAPEDYRLHLPAIYSQYWVGTVGQHMQTALMPFEQTEKEQNQNG